jgi:outer membrane protein OmpA-like peptidoglycan-associated protein
MNHLKKPNPPSLIALLSLVLGTVMACVTATPPELANARSAYARVSTGPAAQVVPADLHKAKVALDQAEESMRSGSDAQRTIDLAYIAERTAQIAEAHAATALSKQKDTKAKQDYNLEQTQINKTTQATLAKTRDQLAEAQRGQAEETKTAGDERGARVEADRKAAASEKRATASEQSANDANTALAKLAAKDEERGTIITLSGSVLFRSNDATLLPAALVRLDQVTDALIAKGRPVVVEGYTDSKGSPASNMSLSQRRAESVRSYIVSRGFPFEKIAAQGLGADRPIADNTSAEGRANNRRVEIVIAKKD